MIGKRLFGGKKEGKPEPLQLEAFQARMEVLHQMFLSSKMIREEWIFFVLPRLNDEQDFVTSLGGLTSVAPSERHSSFSNPTLKSMTSGAFK